jgi:hypothetical protein
MEENELCSFIGCKREQRWLELIRETSELVGVAGRASTTTF